METFKLTNASKNLISSLKNVFMMESIVYLMILQIALLLLTNRPVLNAVQLFFIINLLANFQPRVMILKAINLVSERLDVIGTIVQVNVAILVSAPLT